MSCSKYFHNLLPIGLHLASQLPVIHVYVLVVYFSPLTWNMLAPYGVLHALSRLSFPVLTNHFPAEDVKQTTSAHNQEKIFAPNVEHVSITRAIQVSGG